MKFSGPDSLPQPWQNTSVPGTVLPPGASNVLTVGLPPKIRSPKETRVIPPLAFEIPNSIEAILSQGGSEAGYSAVSSFLSCPERSRLYSLKIRRKAPAVIIEGPGELDELAYGSLMHALGAIRVVHGFGMCLTVLHGLELTDHDRNRAIELITTYEREYPLDAEPFKYLGVELNVFTDLGDGVGGSCVRTVRYDGVIQYIGQQGPFCMSLEMKTAAKGGHSVADQYMPQFATQVTVWNSNPFLVQQFGPMVAVIPNMLIKTTVPKAERYVPRYISRFLQHRMTQYLRLPEQIKMTVAQDGSHPRMMHACWGRYRPCEYINLCWDGAVGDYEQRETKQ